MLHRSRLLHTNPALYPNSGGAETITGLLAMLLHASQPGWLEIAAKMIAIDPGADYRPGWGADPETLR
jgi:hypothetical protein